MHSVRASMPGGTAQRSTNFEHARHWAFLILRLGWVSPLGTLEPSPEKARCGLTCSLAALMEADCGLV
jgi:hypothetical protein